MNIIPKFKLYQLSENLNSKEVRCQCNNSYCMHTFIHDEIIEAFQKTRDAYGKPITVTSGFRCMNHNKDPKVKGAKGSKHTLGMAIDITGEDLLGLELAAREHFEVVIVYKKKNFLHCHIDLVD